MKPVVINGDVWKINRVPLGSPVLVDRTGYPRLATTDPNTRTINLLDFVVPPLVDMVLLHEISHAITVSYDLLSPLRSEVPKPFWLLVEEWSAELMEKHGIEAVRIAAEALGRPLCIQGFCMK